MLGELDRVPRKVRSNLVYDPPPCNSRLGLKMASNSMDSLKALLQEFQSDLLNQIKKLHIFWLMVLQWSL
ncbi:hypothetical protein Taro_006467 [Colocasia esculenta]|uniref:Uncharacterized protein n=1 Tax=Colocasia esculenta TaxID=4460 RepID=A0A843TXR8_COLES|nr:hypothetical protein [Colocasia esculenta]